MAVDMRSLQRQAVQYNAGATPGQLSSAFADHMWSLNKRRQKVQPTVPRRRTSLRLTDSTVHAFARCLQRAGKYEVDGLDGVSWLIEKTVIRDPPGNPPFRGMTPG